MAKKKKWIIWILIIVAIIGGAFFYFKNKKTLTTYTTADVTRGTLAQTVSATGTINANQQIDMSFRTTGVLRSITVDVGDSIRKGQILATIDTGSLLSQLSQAQSQVEVQRQTLDNMKKNKNKFSIDQRDAQRAMIAQAEAGVGVIRDQLKDVDLIAPFDGIVTKRNANPGETMVLNLNSPVLSVIKEGDLIIESNIPESDIAKIFVGQNVEVTLDALTAKDVFRASVLKIDPASTVIQGVVYYRIKIKFDDLDQRFKVGMSTNNDIHTSEAKDALIVPARAVKNDGDKKYVDVLNATDNTTKKVFVETGLEGDEGMVAITSGLKGGEKVVTFITTK